MSDFQVISRERHAGRRWGRHTNFLFAAQERTVNLVAAELPKAALPRELDLEFLNNGGTISFGALG